MIEGDRGPAPAEIDLSREGEFALGDLRVSPSTREVHRNGAGEIIEPRVMQVLVALVRAEGAVVSRDHLIDACWGGRVVGDDAIQRCIARLRRLAGDNDGASFVIETIPRVGYRLVPAGNPATAAFASSVAPPVATGAPDAIPKRGLIVKYAPWALAASAVAAAAVFVFTPQAEPRWRLDDVQIAVASPTKEMHPALSHDGSELAFAFGRPYGDREIHVRRIGQSASRRIVFERGEHYAPAWSPDGGRIAFVTAIPDSPCRISIVAAAGGPSREMVRCRSVERTKLAWSGNRLIFSDGSAVGMPEQVVAVDLTTGRRSEITHPANDGTFDEEPGVSPDGNWVAFTRLVGGTNTRQLTVVDAHSGEDLRVVTRNDSDILDYGWSEDSRALIYGLHRSGHTETWAYFLDGARQQLDSTVVEFGRFSQMRRGRIAAEVVRWTVNLALPPAEQGGKPRVIDRANGRTWRPAFRADGTAAFMSDRSGKPALWIKLPNSEAVMVERLPGSPTGQMAWSPDGARLALVVRDNAGPAVAVITPRGAVAPVIRTPDAQSLNRPAWTADGAALVIPAFDDKGGWRLWRAALNTPDVVTPASSYGWRAILIAGPVVLQIQSGVAGIWRMDGGMRRIVELPSPHQDPVMEFDGERVLYFDWRGDTEVVKAQPIAGGAATIAAEIPENQWDGFGYDPKARQIVYPVGISSDSDIALLTFSQN